MKVMNRSVASLVVGLSLAAGAVSEPSIKAIGGNLIVNRSQVDTYGSYLMDIHHPFEQNGTLTYWEIYAANTKPVQLVIYRQRNGAFLEVGRSVVVTPVVGYNLFRLDKEIKVEAGDFVGANQPGASLGDPSLSPWTAQKRMPLACLTWSAPPCSRSVIPRISPAPRTVPTRYGLSERTPTTRRRQIERCGGVSELMALGWQRSWPLPFSGAVQESKEDHDGKAEFLS